MKKIASALLLSALLLSTWTVSACGSEGADGNCTVWTVDAIQKIRKDGEYDLSSASRKITVSSAKNEYEGWQIIVSGDENVSSAKYDVALSNLTSESGEVYDVENVQLYNELYLDVAPKEYYVDSGLHPDGIVPFDAAKRVGENVVSKNQNCGIYVEFYVPAEQEAGTYTGTFTVSVDGKNTLLPVELTVWDYEISQTTTAKSLFLNNWEFQRGELNSTQEMYNAYTDALLKYRLSPNSLLLENNHSAKCIEQFTELAYEYGKRADFSTISLPFKRISANGATQVYQGEAYDVKYTYDAELLREYIFSLAKKSAETGVNLLDKCVMYFTIIDEPQLHKTQARVIYVSKQFEQDKITWSNEILADSALSGEDITNAELAASVLKISNVVTSYYESDYEGVKIDYCPTPDYYDTEDSRANYADNERWWYCCVGPNNPYPTYHIDDHLLGTRLLYWMGAQYDVVGNLNWGVNSYDVYGEVPEDYFQNAIHNSSQNGEGFLFYPGAKYELNAPVESIRLQAYRDGVEEYEVFHAIKEKYAALSASSGCAMTADNAMDFLTNTLYAGTRWSTTESNFYKQRENLAKLAELALSNEEESVALLDAKQVGSTYTIQAFATDGCKLYVNGDEATPSAAYVGGSLYNISVSLDGYEGRTISLTAEMNGKKTTLDFETGGTMQAFSVDEMIGGLTEDVGADVDIEKIPANGIGDYTDGSLIKFVANGNDVYTSQGVELQADFLSLISQNVNKMQFVFYTEEEVDYEISFLYAKGGMVNGKPIYNLVGSGKLKVGENYVNIVNLDSYNWAKNGSVKKVLITFKTNTEKTVYLREIVLTGV